MNSNQETLQQIIKYEPVLLGFFCFLLIAKALTIPYLEIPLFIFTYSLVVLYLFKIIVSESRLKQMENLIRNAYLLLIILGLLSLVVHVVHWYHFRWAMSIFLVGIPVVVVISLVRKIEFKGVFGETDVFLTTAIYIALLPIFFDQY